MLVPQREWRITSSDIRDALKNLLHPSCKVASVAVTSTGTFLCSEERRYVSHSALKRQSEFLAGRNAAHLALSALDIANEPIAIGECNQPCWPKGIIGSISHCDSYAIAAVAARRDIFAIGIDIAEVQSVPSELWPILFTSKELSFLHRTNLHEQNIWSVILFSLKEAFFKFQYPHTGLWIDFPEVSISLNEDHAFIATTDSSLSAWLASTQVLLVGRFRVVHQYVLSAYSLPATAFDIHDRSSS